MRTISKLYVAAFQVKDVSDDQVCEVILSGIYRDLQNNWYARATVEHEPAALPSLIKLALEIEQETGYCWRLLLFDENGITELNKDDYIPFIRQCKLH